MKWLIRMKVNIVFPPSPVNEYYFMSNDVYQLFG